MPEPPEDFGVQGSGQQHVDKENFSFLSFKNIQFWFWFHLCCLRWDLAMQLRRALDLRLSCLGLLGTRVVDSTILSNQESFDSKASQDFLDP